MTPVHRLRLTRRDKADRSAEAATFELHGLVTHDLILGSSAPIAYARRFSGLLGQSHVLERDLWFVSTSRAATGGRTNRRLPGRLTG